MTPVHRALLIGTTIETFGEIERRPFFEPRPLGEGSFELTVELA